MSCKIDKNIEHERIFTYPPTPENLTVKGDILFNEAIRREPMVSPETSPATKNTLSSPSLAAISTTALLETDVNLLLKPVFLRAFQLKI